MTALQVLRNLAEAIASEVIYRAALLRDRVLAAVDRIGCDESEADDA